MARDRFTITSVDDQDDISFAEADSAEGAIEEAARAIEDLGAVRVAIVKQGDEDD